ncbi:MAG: hypothetical protein WC809_18660 [Sinimarinibacterium sp.]|jgi:hypothetical protein
MNLGQLLCKLLCNCGDDDKLPRAQVTLAVGAISVTATIESKGRIMFTLPVDRVAAGKVAYVDVKGNIARVDGPPKWSSSDENVLAVAASEDGMSATITPLGPLGGAQVKVEADADLGEGFVPVTTLVDVETVGGLAVAGNVSLSLVE